MFAISDAYPALKSNETMMALTEARTSPEHNEPGLAKQCYLKGTLTDVRQSQKNKSGIKGCGGTGESKHVFVLKHFITYKGWRLRDLFYYI